MFCNLNTDSFFLKKKNDLEPSCCFVYVYPAVENTAYGFSLLMVNGVGAGWGWGREMEKSKQLYRAVRGGDSC